MPYSRATPNPEGFRPHDTKAYQPIDGLEDPWHGVVVTRQQIGNLALGLTMVLLGIMLVAILAAPSTTLWTPGVDKHLPY